MVVDPGDNASHILENLKEMEGKVKYIVNTHEHYDHIKANDEIKEEAGGEILGIPEEGKEIRVGEELFKVIATPGHSPKSITMVGNDILFTGDIIYRDRIGRTDLPGGSREDLEKTLKGMEEEYLASGLKIYPGHSEPFDWTEEMRMENYLIKPENYTQI